MKIGFLVSYSIVLVGKGSEVFIESYEGSCFVFDTMGMGWVGKERPGIAVHRRSGLTCTFLVYNLSPSLPLILYIVHW